MTLPALKLLSPTCNSFSDFFFSLLSPYLSTIPQHQMKRPEDHLHEHLLYSFNISVVHRWSRPFAYPRRTSSLSHDVIKSAMAFLFLSHVQLSPQCTLPPPFP